jgi:hypothetical protein
MLRFASMMSVLVLSTLAGFPSVASAEPILAEAFEK